MSKKKSDTSLLDIPVKFGGVSIGQSTARLSMTIERKALNINQADELLCGRRINGQILRGGNNDSPGQTKFIETDLTVKGTFDIHRFGVNADSFTAGATFKLKEINISDLAQFSKGSGRLIASEVEVIPDDAVDEHEDDASGESLPGTYKADGPWAKVSLDDLFSGAVLKALKGAGLSTVGDMMKYQEPEKNGYIKQLSDIKGLGPSKVTQVEDRMVEFWRDNSED